MRNVLQKATTLVVCATAMATAQVAAQAAPKQIVVVVAEGLSPQVVDLGSLYVKKASTEADATAAFDDLKSQSKMATVGADVLSAMRGVLKIAAANGYKTGLVTTGDVTTDAALLYDLPSDTSNVASTLLNSTKPNFLAGGGRAKFSAELTKSFSASNTALLTADDFESFDSETAKGNVLALQNDGDLSYAIDHDASVETGLGDLASLAMRTLGGEESTTPYVLVVHDGNLAKALAAKDTPAVFGEFREIDSLVGEVLSTRGALDTPNDMALAVVSPGAASFPKYTTDTPADRSNAIYVASQLTASYAKATQTLKGATDDDVTAFATDVYPGWKPSADVRAKIIAGTTTGEDAVRASYEPAIALGYEATSVAPMAWVVGLGEGDLVKQVSAAVSTKVPAAKKVK